ncbi:beta family protein [Agrobacterium vitis]|uniref:beta family protein n=1 Tax=Agrobacterium vitis TaxID=373 RepID=UPI003D2D0EB5
MMLPYHPALRFKQGEYLATARISRDLQRHIQPRFILAPPKERDPEKGKPLTEEEIATITGERIAKHWPLFPAYLDAQYVAPFIGDAGLKELFRIAQRRNEQLAVVASVKDLLNPIFRNFLRRNVPRIGIYLPYEDIDTDLLLKAVEAVGCKPSDCVLFVDFTKAPLSVEGVSGSVAGVFDTLGGAAQWARIIFQGSSFPTKNPAENDKQVSIPRYEWEVFQAAMKECSVSPELIGYGDFGADHGEIKFRRKGGGSPPIRHIRYTGKKETIVFRGKDTGKQGDAMKVVCERVLNSGEFAGQGYSYADDMIWRVAKGISTAGTPSMWREWNMAHHLAQVVKDLGAMSDLKFASGPASVAVEQQSLFAEQT